MSFVQVICGDGAVFDLSIDEIACSKLLSSMTSDVTSVSKIKLNNIDSLVMADIQRFMKLTVNPPGDWIDSFIEECSHQLCQLLEASHFLEIDALTDAISEAISKQIQQCRTIQSMRDAFGIQNDMTPFEETCAKTQVLWALADEDKPAHGQPENT